MSESEQMKKAAALAALDYIQSGDIIGVGSGSTANHFIEGLASLRGKLDGAVASSRETEERLRAHRIPVLPLNQAGELRLYVDGADEATRHLHLIKGGGGALTREKIVAAASAQFVCIADRGKLVDRLGAFPLPLEVIAMAQSLVARKLSALGGLPAKREGFTTDEGNIILDVRNLDLTDAAAMEDTLNGLAGVVTNGLFARRPADVLLLGGEDGVEVITPASGSGSGTGARRS